MRTNLVFIFIIIAIPLNAQSWKSVGHTSFSAGEAFSQCLALDGETPYVAYTDRENDRKATVMKFQDNTWVPLGKEGFTDGEANEMSLRISNGTPYLAFIDGANDDRASVMSYSGSGWAYVGTAGFSPGSAANIDLAISNGVPYIAFEDYANNTKATVMKFNGGEWETVGAAGFTTSSLASVISLAVEGSTPYMSYRDYDADYKVSVMKYNNANSQWELLGQHGFGGGTHDAENCLAVRAGVPYVATWNAEAKATVYTYQGAAWGVVGTDGFSAGQARYLSIDFSNDGVLYVVYGDYENFNKATVVKYNGANWIPVGEAASDGDATNISIAISDAGTPFIAFRDNYHMRGTTVMKYGDFASVDNASMNSDFNIFPNPSGGVFTIELRDGEYQLKIVNQLGQTVLKKESNFKTRLNIDLSDEAPGIYQLIISDKDKVLTSRKLLMTHKDN